jgi:hypothetical protein
MKKKRCEFAVAMGTAAAPIGAGAAAEASSVSGVSTGSEGASSTAGGTSSLGCIGAKLMRLPQRARTVFPQKVSTYSPFLMSRGFCDHLILSPLRNVDALEEFVDRGKAAAQEGEVERTERSVEERGLDRRRISFRQRIGVLILIARVREPSVVG